jgi:transketolase
MPCWEAFDAQPAAYRADILGHGVLRVSVEAGVTLGWERYVGDGLTLGIDGFGASAPIEALYEKFGLTGDAVAAQVRARLAV